MKTIKKTLLLISLLLTCFSNIKAQVESAKIYWVGHSLMSHYYGYDLSKNLIELMDDMATSQSKTYDYHQHTIPGSPLRWNWGNSSSWADVGPLIAPLTSSTHAEYGSFDVIVLTESIDILNAFSGQNSSFYARKFYNAAKNANSDTRLFMYESWHHYQAGDAGLGYGNQADFEWKDFMLDARLTWDSIIDFASDPALTQIDTGYSYLGAGTDPGDGTNVLDIKIIPTGRVLVEVMDRLNENLATDDWDYNGIDLTDLDFFENPLANFPTDLVTKVHPADALDDIHPSNVLVYLNSLVHYAVIYKDDPINLPVANGVPENIANIFKEIAWDVVVNDERTGVTEEGNTSGIKENIIDRINVFPNPTTDLINIDFEEEFDGTISIVNISGQVLKELSIENNQVLVDISALTKGMYFLKGMSNSKVFVRSFLKE